MAKSFAAAMLFAHVPKIGQRSRARASLSNIDPIEPHFERRKKHARHSVCYHSKLSAAALRAVPLRQFRHGALPLTIESTPEQREVLGFGVALTASSCYELNTMSPEARKAFLQDIFSEKGLNLSVGRLSIGSSDYSAELFSYDDVDGDETLEHFSVVRDERYVIPMVKEALQVNPDLYLFGSPWSPPGWMKTGGAMCGGYMRDRFVDCYARYFIKYLQAYEAHGIPVRAVTPQNEPETDQSGLMPACPLESGYRGAVRADPAQAAAGRRKGYPDLAL